MWSAQEILEPKLGKYYEMYLFKDHKNKKSLNFNLKLTLNLPPPPPTNTIMLRKFIVYIDHDSYIGGNAEYKLKTYSTIVVLITKLLQILYVDQDGPMACPGMDHLPHLAPEEVQRVKLENGDKVGLVAFI